MSNENSKCLTRSYSGAEMHLHSVLSAALTINNIHDNGLDLNELVKGISEHAKEIVIEGDIRGIESMLVTQAKTLGVLFHKMTSMAMGSNSLEQMQGLTEIGLKAQKLCRQTLSALAELKQPRRATFVKQQNVAVNQQVNNINSEQNLENLEKSANELLKEKPHEALDGGRAPETITINSQMEAMVPCKGGDNA